jgi:hypothetical protein
MLRRTLSMIARLHAIALRLSPTDPQFATLADEIAEAEQALQACEQIERAEEC